MVGMPSWKAIIPSLEFSNALLKSSLALSVMVRGLSLLGVPRLLPVTCSNSYSVSKRCRTVPDARLAVILLTIAWVELDSAGPGGRLGISGWASL